MGDTFYNIAQDEAFVGIQAGRVHGNVVSGSVSKRASHRELEKLLEEVRGELRAARLAGRIDATSADAVTGQLDEAADTLPVTDEESRRKFLVALKKAKGLVEGLAVLTEKVAAAIAAVHGM
jgi:adenosylhomocysteine nucleosidase